MPKPKSRYTSIDKRSLGLTVGENVRPPPEVLARPRPETRTARGVCLDPKRAVAFGDSRNPAGADAAIDQRDPSSGEPASPPRAAPGEAVERSMSR